MDIVLAQTTADSGLTATDWIVAGASLVVSIIVARLARTATRRVVAKLGGDQDVGTLLGRVIALVVVAIGFVYALNALGVQIGPMLGALGIAGLAVALALQDILANFLAGIILQIRRPFVAGDQVISNGHEGNVVDVNSRTVVIDTTDGERVHIPASDVISNAIINHTTRGARRTSITVGVAYGTDLDRAKAILQDAAASVDEVHPDPAPEAFASEFGASSIDFVVRFWHDAEIRSSWVVRDQVTRAVKRQLDDAEITIPFPQRVVWQPDLPR